jgi:hypothetical protein
MKLKIIAITSTMIITGGTYLLGYYSYEFGKNLAKYHSDIKKEEFINKK